MSAAEKLYKTLCNGRSWHGGEHAWSLPTQGADGTWTPGEWTPRVTPRVCSEGWHLTSEPARWWSADEGVACFLAEHDGAVSRRDGEDKIACERVRLLRPLTEDELATVGIYTRGSHDASGRAVVWASGSATVQAWDSATVEAWGSATVEASGSATVRAWDSATVRAWDSAKAHAGGQSTCVAWVGTTLVLTRSDAGVIVDRRWAAPKTYTKRAGLDGWRFRGGKWVQVKVRAKAGAP